MPPRRAAADDAADGAAGRAPRLEPFTGGGSGGLASFDAWLRTATFVVALQPEEERMRLLRSAIQGSAQLMLSALYVDADLEGIAYDAFLQRLRAAFGRPLARDEILSALAAVRLGAGEALEDFNERFLRALAPHRAALPAADAATMYIAALGAFPAFQSAIRATNPETPIAAVTAARANVALLVGASPSAAAGVRGIAAVAAAGPEAAQGAVTSAALVAALRELGLGTRGRGGGGRRGWRPRGGEASQGALREIVCFTCGGKGHVARVCPSRAGPVEAANKASKSYLSGSWVGKKHEDMTLSTTITTKDNTAVPARTLIDSGAEMNLISQKFVRVHKLHVEPAPLVAFTYADGSTFHCAQQVVVTLQAGAYTVELPLRVCALSGIDVILGHAWLAAANPTIDWRDGSIVIPGTTQGASPQVLRQPRASRTAAVAAQRQGEGEADVPNAMAAQRTATPVFRVVTAKSMERVLRKRATVEFTAAVDVAAAMHDEPMAAVHGVSSATAPSGDAQRMPACEEPLLQPVLREFAELFQPPPGLPPLREPALQHRILLEQGAVPPARRPYRLSWAEREELRRQLEQLMQQGLIQPSVSPYAAPVLLIKKKDGTFRLCVDFRALNKVTIRDCFPLPLIQDLLDQLRGAHIFSKLDLKSGYWQLRMAESDEEKTAFVTPFGTFQFRVLAMGLTNAPATFQRAMARVLRPLMEGHGACVAVYLDDILVYSASPAQHAQHLRAALQLLQQHQLHLHPDKCTLGARQVVFLGHTISPGKVAVEEDKMAAVQSWRMPRTRVALQQFLGFANFYRHFVPDFARIATPLTDMLAGQHTGPNFRLNSTAAAHTAFHLLRQRLLSAPVLAMPDPTQAFTVHTDASDTAVGAVLEQNGHPVAYFSKRLSAAEENYPIRDKELAAQVFALDHWRVYLANGRHFELFTDHHSLTSFSSAELSTGRLARWAGRLADYNFTVIYRKGEQNRADALSRVETAAAGETTAVAAGPAAVAAAAAGTAAMAGGVVNLVHTATSLPGAASLREMMQEFHDDAYFHTIVLGLHDPAAKARMGPVVQRRLERFTVHEGALFLREADGRLRRCVAGRQRVELLREFHDTPLGGHAGVDRMYAALRQTFFWPGMVKSVARFVDKCDSCSRNKPALRPYVVPAQPLEVPTQPWEAISLDYLDLPLTVSGHDCLLSVTDVLSNYIHAIPTTRTVTAAETVDLLLQHVVRLHGVPTSMVSDRDSRFTSAVWEEFWERLGTRLRMSTAHRPQADGRSERTNQTLVAALRPFANAAGSDWDQPHILSMLELGLNYKINAATGVSPFQLAQGFQPLLPATLTAPRPLAPDAAAGARPGPARDMAALWRMARTAIEDAQGRQRQQAAAGLAAERSPALPQVGDLVLLDTRSYPALRASKLQPPFVGPFKVVERPSPGLCKLELPPSMRIHPVVNVDALKPYSAAAAAAREAPQPVGATAKGERLWAIERIVGDRVWRGQRQFKIRWKGCGPEEDSWEPATEFRKFPELRRQYEATRPRGARRG